MSAATPGQAAYEAYRAAVMAPMPKWDDLSHQAKRGWEAAAKAVLDLVTPEDVAKAGLAAQDARPAPTSASQVRRYEAQPAPELAAAMAVIARVRAVAEAAAKGEAARLPESPKGTLARQILEEMGPQ